MNRCFGSDNFSGVLPEVMQAINQCNSRHVPSYGYDKITIEAKKKFRKLFCKKVEVYFVFNGTAANILGISALVDSYHSVICSATSHLHTDECGAAEKHIGCKVMALPSKDGKLYIKDIKKLFRKIRFNDEHQSQPKLISITQCTEYGTVYSPKEIKDLADFAHRHRMYLHMDGARIANATAYLKTDITELTTKAGVDVLSFGGTKNGLMYGEVVIFLNQELRPKVKYIRKQQMQLASKMRFLTAQFNALLTNNLWLKTAAKSNSIAQLLANELAKIPQIQLTQNTQANMVFAVLPEHIIAPLQKELFFYLWNAATHEVRLVCSFDNTEEDVHRFVSYLKKLL